MIRTSDKVSALFAALAKAQADMPSAAKDTTGQVGNAVRKYADLPSVREAARAPLTANDLAFVQFPASALPGYVRVITRIVHSSGEWIEDDEGVSVPTGNNTAQAVGSAMTYARRYSLMSALGIVADDDDDGHAASTARPTRARGTTSTAPTDTAKNPDGPTPAMTAKVMALFGEAGLGGEANREERLKFTGAVIGRDVTSWNQVTKAEGIKVIDAVQEFIAGRLEWSAGLGVLTEAARS